MQDADHKGDSGTQHGPRLNQLPAPERKEPGQKKIGRNHEKLCAQSHVPPAYARPGILFKSASQEGKDIEKKVCKHTDIQPGKPSARRTHLLPLPAKRLQNSIEQPEHRPRHQKQCGDT